MDKKFILHAPIKKIGEIVKHFGDRDDMAYVFIRPKSAYSFLILDNYQKFSDYVYDFPNEKEESLPTYIKRISEKLSAINQNIIIAYTDSYYHQTVRLIAGELEILGSHYCLKIPLDEVPF